MYNYKLHVKWENFEHVIYKKRNVIIKKIFFSSTINENSELKEKLPNELKNFLSLR